MKIGILMAGGFGLTPHTDGRKVQIQKQADALERIGHEVVRLNPWGSYDLNALEAVHLVEGGVGNIPGAYGKVPGVRKMGVAPFLDTTCPSWLYRLIGVAGSVHPRLMTHQGVLYRQSKICDVVIARSQDERRLLVSGLGVEPGKVRIVLNGVDPPGPVEPDAVRKEFGIEGDFAFHVSMYTQPRKNLRRLIEAVTPLGMPLVVAGTAPESPAKAAIHEAGRHANVRFIGQLTPRQRDSLYAACRVFCLPSTYEGTGLVAMEAASHGAPVVITKTGGPPDYFADLAEYVDPSDVGSIRSGVERAWNQPRDGRLKAHVIGLSWEASARQLVAAYES